MDRLREFLREIRELFAGDDGIGENVGKAGLLYLLYTWRDAIRADIRLLWERLRRDPVCIRERERLFRFYRDTLRIMRSANRWVLYSAVIGSLVAWFGYSIGWSGLERFGQIILGAGAIYGLLKQFVAWLRADIVIEAVLHGVRLLSGAAHTVVRTVVPPAILGAAERSATPEQEANRVRRLMGQLLLPLFWETTFVSIVLVTEAYRWPNLFVVMCLSALSLGVLSLYYHDFERFLPFVRKLHLLNFAVIFVFLFLKTGAVQGAWAYTMNSRPAKLVTDSYDMSMNEREQKHARARLSAERQKLAVQKDDKRTISELPQVQTEISILEKKIGANAASEKDLVQLSFYRLREKWLTGGYLAGGREPVMPQCADGIDNDGDGNIDYPDDPGCSSYGSPLERVKPQCADGIDNDGDGKTDDDDPGCKSSRDNNEADHPHPRSDQCADGIDNDDDGDTDIDDADCWVDGKYVSGKVEHPALKEEELPKKAASQPPAPVSNMQAEFRELYEDMRK